MTDRPDLLSARGRALVDAPPMPEYLVEHFARQGTPGYVPLCIAENRLVWDLLQPKMAACRDVPHEALCYDAMIGSERFRAALARFMGRTFLGREVGPEQLAVLAGAGSVLELLFYALGDPGDGVLVPTPSYAGFWLDLETRNALEIVPVHCRSEDRFRLTRERLDAALEGAGRPVRALLFTTPNNPLGAVYGRDELEEVRAWTEERGLHLVLDEVYALSVFGERPFVSGASLRETLGDAVHVVWAFSKDFGASGLRCGVLLSENERLLKAVDALAYWACCSGDTQHLLACMVADDAWVDGYVRAMQARLGDAYRSTAAALDAAAIPYLPAEAGFFVLCDLRSFLEAPTWEAERALWRRLLERTDVNLTPGAACRAAEPGLFRLCFPGVSPEAAVAAVARVGAELRAT